MWSKTVLDICSYTRGFNCFKMKYFNHALVSTREKSISTKSTKSEVENSEVDQTMTKLINWAMTNHISYKGFSKLISILHDLGCKNLPKNAKDLLLSREKNIQESALLPGDYIHFGFETNLKRVISALEEVKLLKGSEINVSIFIDHLPLSDKSKIGMWPILGSVVGFHNIIFLIGSYQGYAKPTGANLFLNEFINEAKSLCRNGFQLNNTKYKVSIKRLVCDAPAKVFVLGIKNYTKYSSCTKCHAVGEYMNKKMCFPDKSDPKTDEDFHKSEMYTSDKTKFLEIPNFGIVSNVPLDYLHLACVGVVKKLIVMWLNEGLTSSKNVSNKLLKLADYKPLEFDSKPKPIEINGYWTPFHFRQFLLYFGPVVLQFELNEKFYNHFLILHSACRMLSMNNNEKWLQVADLMLNKFVKDFEPLYGRENISHNVHGLYHLVDDCKHHGTLDSFSAFPFEKFLLQLRNLIRKEKKSLPKMNLLNSYENIFTKRIKKLKVRNSMVSKKIKDSDSSLPGEFSSFSQYQNLIVNHTQIIPSKQGDRFVCLKNGKVIEVRSILMNKSKQNKVCFISGKEFNSVSDFYNEPVKSTDLSVFKVKDLSDVVGYWSVDLIDKKCVKVPLNEDESVMVGLLNEDF